MNGGRTLLIAVILVVSAGCAIAAGGLLRTGPAAQADATDVYSLILYGARHSSDLESVAILDLENDGYVLMPEGPAFEYRILQNVKGAEAVRLGEEFIGWHRSFMRSSLSAILAPDGTVIGFELTPRYNFIDFGTDEVLDISYRLKEQRVTVHIRLKPGVERILEGDGTDRMLRNR